MMPSKNRQLDREIAEALATPTPVASASAAPRQSAPHTQHSTKALGTLAIMGTAPSQWHLTPIDWVEEEREVPGLVSCPTCHGRKFVRIEEGQVLPSPSSGSPEDFDYHSAARRDAHRAGRPYGNCPTCARPRRGWGLLPQGKVEGRIRAKVMVGYPRFPPGTKFDSRYHGGLHCNLCNKLILKSRRVPVHATGDDGITHGMFVGEDCARKFLDVKLRREKDSIMEAGNGPKK